MTFKNKTNISLNISNKIADLYYVYDDVLKLLFIFNFYNYVIL